MGGAGETVRFRSERDGERAAVRAIVEDAFGDPWVEGLVDALRASPDWIDGMSFVAETHVGLVGHILFTRSLLDAPPRLVDVLVLSPVSVATAHQGRGIGSGLVRHGLEQVARRPEPLVFLEGRRRTTAASASSLDPDLASVGRRCASPNPHSRSSGCRATSHG
jgi:putative acetyltransferase